MVIIYLTTKYIIIIIIIIIIREYDTETINLNLNFYMVHVLIIDRFPKVVLKMAIIYNNILMTTNAMESLPQPCLGQINLFVVSQIILYDDDHLKKSGKIVGNRLNGQFSIKKKKKKKKKNFF